MDKHDGRATARPRAGAAAGTGDPWYDPLDSAWGERRAPDGRTRTSAAPARAVAAERSTAGVYLEVQRSAAFQEVRGRYRRFVVPAAVIFFVWYVAYVVTATTAPGLMAEPVAGAVNVAMLAGLGQFASTFLLTWLYVRHARLRRDRAALELRWDTQEMTRGIGEQARTSGNGAARGEGGQR
ncbi:MULTISPECIES: DUF485 domain-containing protein [unclassified Streptomyces]|uniref:DUF485 domain-containing protein n=1 Tax=unclassified Streptomyces TaxID=2593676 RepID=UPI00278C30D5|nr:MULTISPECIES: DUF485 domain-containing protein [unclassified Streptomyces]